MIKNLFFFITAIAFSITAVSQQQPENPGFEEWENVGLSNDEPVNWSSLKTSDNGLANTFAPYVWEQSTDVHSGNYSVKLINKYVSIASTTAAGTLTNGRIHAELSGVGWAFTNQGNDQWNTPITQKPDSVVIWVKYSPIGSDTAALKALLHTGDAQIPQADMSTWVSLAQINIPYEVATWTRFSAPFTYFSDDTPEYILFVLSSGGIVAVEDSEVYYDDLELIYNPISLDLTAFLEGPYFGSGQMNAGLNPGTLPLAQPYNTAPWNYTGTESVASIPNAEVVDWVMVELRDAANAAAATSATTIARQAGFILQDGSIVGLDGVSRFTFNNTFDYDISENLYVVINHRSHLSIMSADPLVKNSGFYTYDFTDDSAKTHGGTNGIKQLSLFGPSVWGMIGGDGDANGTINSVDKTSFWSVLTGKTGYLSGDYNMDGQINNTDKNDVWLDNIDETTQVPN